MSKKREHFMSWDWFKTDLVDLVYFKSVVLKI